MNPVRNINKKLDKKKFSGKIRSGTGISNRMKNFRFFIFFVILVSPFHLTHAFVSSTELIENSKKYDLKEICIRGEVIGDIFIKKDFTWINISDGINAIGIWIPKNLTEQFSPPGDYTHRGDLVQITGKFYRTCSEHIGEIDIHAEDMVILKKGENISYPVDRIKVITSAILFLLASVLFVFEMYLRKRNIKNEPEG